MKWFSRSLLLGVTIAFAAPVQRPAWSQVFARGGPAPDQPAVAAPADANAPGGRSVQLPFSLKDEAGNTWDIDQDGSIANGGGDMYDGGGHLLFDNGQAGYSSVANVATVTPAGDELLFPPIDYNGLKISRRVAVGGKAGWCRFVEVIQNPTAAAVQVRLQLDFGLPNGIQASEPLTDDKQPAKPQLGVAIFGGHGAVAMIGAGRNSKVLATFVPKPDEPSVEFTYTLDVPAKKTVAIVHMQVRRKTLDEAVSAFSSSKEKDYFTGLPSDVAKEVVNFPKAGAGLDDIDLLRGDLLDVVELRSGDQYKGTLKEPTWKLQTAYGPIELPAERVVGMTTSGEHRPVQMLITADGEVFTGTLQNAAGGAAAAPASGVRMQLSSGQTTQIPLSSISRIGYRRRDNEPEEWTFDKPLVSLISGDRIKVDLPSGEIPVTTRYGTLRLDASSVGVIDFQPNGLPVHEVVLTDGSRFAGLVARERFDFKPLSITGGRTLSLPTPALSRLICSHEPPKSDPEAPAMSLLNGDRLVGTIDGKIVLDTAFDAIELNAAEIRAVKHGERPVGATTVASPSELQITLWDNATLSGRLRGDSLSCHLKSGPVVAIPVSLLGTYEQPLPRPPASAVERIKKAVADLSSAEWQARDRATEQLIDLGPGIIGVLRDLRAAQTGDGAKRLDDVIGNLEEARKAKPAVAPQPLQQQMQEEQFNDGANVDGPDDAMPADEVQNVPGDNNAGNE